MIGGVLPTALPDGSFEFKDSHTYAAAGKFTVTVQIAHQETGSGTSPTLVITPGGAGVCNSIALTPPWRNTS